jgi:hypothetical protein
MRMVIGQSGEMTAAKDSLQGPPISVSFEGGFLCSFRKHMRDIHDLLRQEPPSLFIVCWSSISVTPIMMQSTCLDSLDEVLEFCSWMQCFTATFFR